MKTRILFTLALLTGTVTLAIAQQGPTPFYNFDSDGDGVVTEQEFDRFHADRMAARAAQGRAMRNRMNRPDFAMLDKDGDGLVSQQELQQFQQARMQAMRGAMPPRRMLNRPHMMPAQGFKRPVFADIDANGDACIDAQELEAFQLNRMRGLQGMMPGRPGMPMPGRYGKGGTRGGGYSMPSYEAFDLDGDGKIVEDEFVEARGQRVAKRAAEGRMMRGLANMSTFADIDVDGDGQISRDEFSTHQAEHRQRRWMR